MAIGHIDSKFRRKAQATDRNLEIVIREMVFKVLSPDEIANEGCVTKMRT